MSMGGRSRSTGFKGEIHDACGITTRRTERPKNNAKSMEMITPSKNKTSWTDSHTVCSPNRQLWPRDPKLFLRERYLIHVRISRNITFAESSLHAQGPTTSSWPSSPARQRRATPSPLGHGKAQAAPSGDGHDTSSTLRQIGEKTVRVHYVFQHASRNQKD